MYLCRRIYPIDNLFIIMYIIIIADGLFPTSPTLLECLPKASYVVCCDGALSKYLKWCRTMDCRPSCPIDVVGDGDSLPPSTMDEARQMGLAVRHFPVAEQESNDLSKAVRHVMHEMGERNVPPEEVEIDILGATGLREDHTLANISLLACYGADYPGFTFRMCSDFGTFYSLRGCRRFASRKGQQVSLFSLTPQVPVRVEGLRYPIENRCLTWWWEGSLNEALGDTFVVEGGRMIVYLSNVVKE